MTNDPLAGFLADLDHEEDILRQDTIRAIKHYAVERDNEKQAKDSKDSAASVLKEWFKTHPEETELVDGEWGLKAFLQTRRLPGHKYDLTAIIENNPSLFARLVSTRALLIDHDVAVAQGLEGEIKRYAMPSGETQALIVRPIE